MSSYSVAQLAAMERERIRENIKKSISIICNDKNRMIINRGLTYDFNSKDEIVSGVDENIFKEDVKTDSFNNSSGSVASKIDLSVLLDDVTSDQFENRVQELLKEINEIECNNKENLDKVNSFVHWLNGITGKREIDAEEKVKLIQNRLDALRSSFVSDVNDDTYEEIEYKTLCEKLSIEAKTLPKEHLISEIKRLYEQLFLIEEQRYVESAITEIIEEEMGLSLEGKCNLDEADGFLYNSSELESCKIFVSADGEGIMLDSVAPPDNDKDKIETEAKKVCELKETIVKKALERGIILKTEVEIEPNYESMSKTTDIVKTGESQMIQTDERRRNKRSNQKGMTV